MSEDVKIPGNSEKVIPGYVAKVESRYVPNCLLIEPSKECVKRGLVTKALVNPNQNIIPVRVINPSEDSCELFKGTTLGNCSLVDSVLSDTAEVKLGSVSLESEIIGLPEYLEPIFEDSIVNLTNDQQDIVKSLLWSYKDLFAKRKSDRGKTHLVKHTINTGDHKSIKQRPRHMPLAKREAEREEVDKMLQAGVIEPSSSPWASPIVLVTKKDGSVRYCIDYRQLNNIIFKDSYPLPHSQDCLESLRESKWFSTLDLQSGYW